MPSTNGNVPSHWYQYDFPLEEVANSPKPSGANYDPKNVAWMIEMFASILGKSHTELQFVYENNTPNDRNDDIFVQHPNDKLYFYETQGKQKSDELLTYEAAAQKSDRLRAFQDNSPANIEYFQPLG
jgi:hypothetical protein